MPDQESLRGDMKGMQSSWKIPGAELRQARPERSIQVGPSCRWCSRTKRRCSRDRPSCHSCLDLGKACTYDSRDPGLSRHEALKRRHRAQQEQLDDLNELLHRIRHQDEGSASSIYRALRAGTKPRELLDRLRKADFQVHRRSNAMDANLVRSDIDNVLADPGGDAQLRRVSPGCMMPPTSSEPGSSSGSSPVSSSVTPSAAKGWSPSVDSRSTGAAVDTDCLGLAVHPGSDKASSSATFSLANPRLARIAYESWTSVEASRVEIANLLSLYLSCWHDYQRHFDEERFLDHLLNSDPDPGGSILLNACCVVGCHQLSYSEHGRRAGDLIGRFYAEAESSWTANMGHPGLYMIPAAAVLSGVSYFKGNQAMATRYISQAYHTATRLGLFGTNAAPAAAPEIPEDQAARRAYQEKSVIAWGLFNLVSYGMGKPPFLHF